MTSYSQLVFVIVTVAVLAFPASAKSDALPGSLLLAPGDRATAGVTAWLFVLSKNMWCPTLKSELRPI